MSNEQDSNEHWEVDSFEFKSFECCHLSPYIFNVSHIRIRDPWFSFHHLCVFSLNDLL